MTQFRLPDLGEGLQEAEIVSWHVAEGQRVVVDQPLLSVETDKAVVEIPSPQAGRIARLLVRPGQRVPVGAALLEFDGDAMPEAAALVGELPETAPSGPARPVAQPEAVAHVAATPAVRARARDLGIDLAIVRPRSPGGVLTLADVEAAAAGPGVVGVAAGAPLRGARRTMALNMARAGREIVPATLHDRADIEHWKMTDSVTERLIHAVAVACRAEPALNAAFDPTALSVRQNPRINLGLAVDSPDGLFVPVLRDIAGIVPSELRQRVQALKRGVAARSLAPADLQGATITLSNFGSIAGLHAVLVVLPPQVAIVGCGRRHEITVRTADGIAVHASLPLSLTFDHRAVNGGEAARFMRALVADLERPDLGEGS